VGKDKGAGRGLGTGLGLGLGLGGSGGCCLRGRREGKGVGRGAVARAGKEEADWKLTAQRLEAAFQGL